MKCPKGNDNMIFYSDEYLWECPHCGYYKFAWRSAYNQLKKEAQTYKGNLQNFLDDHVETVRELAIKAWSKTHSKIEVLNDKTT